MSVKVPKTHFWVLLWAFMGLWAQNAIFMGPKNLNLGLVILGLPYLTDKNKKKQYFI